MKPRQMKELKSTMDHSLVPAPNDLVCHAPSTAEELINLLQQLKAVGQRACIRGGGCSTSGRIFSASQQIQMSRFSALSIEGQTLICGGGTDVQTVAQALRTSGYWLPVLPSSPKSTVGGVLAAGGFGPASLRYGGLYAALREVTIATPTHGLLRIHRSEDRDGIFALVPGSLGGLGPIVEARFELSQKTPSLAPTQKIDTRPLQEIAAELIQGPTEAATIVSNDLQRWNVLRYDLTERSSVEPLDLHADLHAREHTFQLSEAQWLQANRLEEGSARRVWADFLVPLESVGALQNAFEQEAPFPNAFQVYNAMAFDKTACAGASSFPLLPLGGPGPVVSLGTYVTLPAKDIDKFSERIARIRAHALAIGGRQYLHGAHPYERAFFLAQFGRPTLDRLTTLRCSLGLDNLFQGF